MARMSPFWAISVSTRRCLTPGTMLAQVRSQGTAQGPGPRRVPRARGPWQAGAREAAARAHSCALSSPLHICCSPGAPSARISGVKDQGVVPIEDARARAARLPHRGWPCLVQAPVAHHRIRQPHPKLWVVVVAVLPEVVEPGDVAALAAKGGAAHKKREERLGAIARGVVAAHEHRVSAGDGHKLVVGHAALVHLLDQAIHVVDALHAHGFRCRTQTHRPTAFAAPARTAHLGACAPRPGQTAGPDTPSRAVPSSAPRPRHPQTAGGRPPAG